jgi:hypothetical protein
MSSDPKKTMPLTEKLHDILSYSIASSPLDEAAKKSTSGRNEKSPPKLNASPKCMSGRNSEPKSKRPNGGPGMMGAMVMRRCQDFDERDCFQDKNDIMVRGSKNCGEREEGSTYTDDWQRLATFSRIFGVCLFVRFYLSDLWKFQVEGL